MSDLPRSASGTTKPSSAIQDVPATTSSASRPSAPRASQPTQPTAQPQTSRSTYAAPIRSPIEIMASRQAREAAREAARRAEVESAIEEQARADVESQRRSFDRRPLSGVAAGSGRGTAISQDPQQPRSRAMHDPSPPQASDVGLTGWDVPRHVQSRNQRQSQQQQSQSRLAESSQMPQAQQEHPQQRPRSGNPTYQGPSSSGAPGPSTNDPARPSGTQFLHAFERWEMLSSHWEGLTSYWIRKLQSNNDEIRGDPERAQMARQLTDLAAAGANLFHAVVELQRLRASSERKFQRWFYETRTQLEQGKEEAAGLRQALADEQNRKPTITQDDLNALDSRMREIRREQQISQNEARRAWEELGRREQADRDAASQLRRGLPIFIHGVQVVPMNPGGQHAYQQQQQPRYAYPDYAAMPSEMSPMQASVAQGYGSLYDPPQQPSPTDTDPFSGSAAPSASRPHTTSAIQPFPSGPSPPPLGSMRASLPGTTSQPHAGVSPAVARVQQQRYAQSPSNFPFPSPVRMPPGVVPSSNLPLGPIPPPFYAQPGQYLHQQQQLQPSASPYSQTQYPHQQYPPQQYQPEHYQQQQSYAHSESDSDGAGDDYELEPGALDPPPPPAEDEPEHEHEAESESPQQEPGSPEHDYSAGITPSIPEPHEREPHYAGSGGTFLHYGPEGSSPEGFAPEAGQDQEAAEYESAEYEEEGHGHEVDYEGQGYGSETGEGEWQGMQAHTMHATRLSDVLEEEESMKSPSSQRSSRVPATQGQQGQQGHQ